MVEKGDTFADAKEIMANAMSCIRHNHFMVQNPQAHASEGYCGAEMMGLDKAMQELAGQASEHPEGIGEQMQVFLCR